MRAKIKNVVVALMLLIALSGCVKPRIIKNPQALMIVHEGKAQVSVEVDGQLVEYGWIYLQEGWVIDPMFDWEGE